MRSTPRAEVHNDELRGGEFQRTDSLPVSLTHKWTGHPTWAPRGREGMSHTWTGVDGPRSAATRMPHLIALLCFLSAMVPPAEALYLLSGGDGGWTGGWRGMLCRGDLMGNQPTRSVTVRYGFRVHSCRVHTAASTKNNYHALRLYGFALVM
eukprot:647421-Prymnesium_polylepis.1